MLIFQIIAALMMIFFIYATAVQWNDHDMWIWMSIYGLCAVFSGFAAFHRFHWVSIPATVAYIAGTTYWMPRTPLANKMDFFRDMKMVNMGVEEWRETGGLAICATWCAILSGVWYLYR